MNMCSTCIEKQNEEKGSRKGGKKKRDKWGARRRRFR